MCCESSQRFASRYDMEDAMIINKSSMERGLCHGTMFKTETVDLKPLRAKGDAITTEFRKGPKRAKWAGAEKDEQDPDNYIDVDGLPYVGQVGRAVCFEKLPSTELFDIKRCLRCTESLAHLRNTLRGRLTESWWHIQKDCIVSIAQLPLLSVQTLKSDNPYVSAVNKITQKEKLTKLKGSEDAVVDQVGRRFLESAVS